MLLKYYAVLKPSDKGYFVEFPDLENVFTDGRTLIEAVHMAQDVLLAMYPELDLDELPKPSKAADIPLKDGESLIMVRVDTDKAEAV